MSAHQHFIANQLRSPAACTSRDFVGSSDETRVCRFGKWHHRRRGSVCTATALTAVSTRSSPHRRSGAPALDPPGAPAAVSLRRPGRRRFGEADGYHILRTAPNRRSSRHIALVRWGWNELRSEQGAPLPAGSFFEFPSDMLHYVYADGVTVLHIYSTGPWGLTYLNPLYDPRKRRSAPLGSTDLSQHMIGHHAARASSISPRAAISSAVNLGRLVSGSGLEADRPILIVVHRISSNSLGPTVLAETLLWP